MDYNAYYFVVFIFVLGLNQACFATRTVKDVWNDVEGTVVNETQYIEKKVVEEWDKLTEKDYGSCSCFNYSCGCCGHVEEPEIHLNSTICVNITYLVHDYGISFTLTLNNYTLYNETVSARNPPPICIGVPYVKELAEACVRLYDIDATTTHLHACVRVEARMKKILIAKYELGCFNIGPPEIAKEHMSVVRDKGKLLEMLSSSSSSPMDVTAIVLIVTGVMLTLTLIYTVVKIFVRRKRGLITGPTEHTYLIPTA